MKNLLFAVLISLCVEVNVCIHIYICVYVVLYLQKSL